MRFHGLGLLFFISINTAYRKRSVFLALLYDTLHELRSLQAASAAGAELSWELSSHLEKSQIGQDKSLELSFYGPHFSPSGKGMAQKA